MDAGTADTINRLDVALLVAHLDALDTRLTRLTGDRKPWHLGPFGEAFLSDHPSDSSYKAWLIGRHAWRIPDLHFDGAPADCDWDNFFGHVRTAILTRRADRNPPATEAENRCGSVV